MINYIASEGEKGNWNTAIMELGINVLRWEPEKIISRVTNAVSEVAGRNPDKKIFVILRSTAEAITKKSLSRTDGDALLPKLYIKRHIKM